MQILVTPYKFARGMRAIYQGQEYVVTRAFFDFEKGWSYNLTSEAETLVPAEVLHRVPENELVEPDPPNDRGPVFHAMFRQISEKEKVMEAGGIDILFLDWPEDYYGGNCSLMCILRGFHSHYHADGTPYVVIGQTRPASNEAIARSMEYLASYGQTYAENANWHESYWNVKIVQKDHSWIREIRHKEAARLNKA